MHTIHALPRRVKEFLLTHPLYKSLSGNYARKITPLR